jgi:hypothetical protein
MSIVSGAVAERMKLWAFLLFAVVMTGFIYPVQGYWTWGGGWLDWARLQRLRRLRHRAPVRRLRGLAGVLLLGARKGKYGKPTAASTPSPAPTCRWPRSAPSSSGWAGSASTAARSWKVSNIASANAVAGVFVNTNMAAAGGLVLALITARLLFGKADLTMALNGALAGLVAITAEPLTPTPAGGDADRRRRRRDRGVLHHHPRQAAHRRPGRRHLGARRRRHVGSDGGADHQRRGQLRRQAIGRHHLRLGLRHQPSSSGCSSS